MKGLTRSIALALIKDYMRETDCSFEQLHAAIKKQHGENIMTQRSVELWVSGVVQKPNNRAFSILSSFITSDHFVSFVPAAREYRPNSRLTDVGDGLFSLYSQRPHLVKGINQEVQTAFDKIQGFWLSKSDRQEISCRVDPIAHKPYAKFAWTWDGIKREASSGLVLYLATHEFKGITSWNTFLFVEWRHKNAFTASVHTAELIELSHGQDEQRFWLFDHQELPGDYNYIPKSDLSKDIDFSTLSYHLRGRISFAKRNLKNDDVKYILDRLISDVLPHEYSGNVSTLVTVRGKHIFYDLERYNYLSGFSDPDFDEDDLSSNEMERGIVVDILPPRLPIDPTWMSIDKDVKYLFISAENNNVEGVKKALTTVDVNARDPSGMTALHFAAGSLSVDVIKYLLAVPGIDATIADNYARSAATVAVESWDFMADDVVNLLNPHCYPWLHGPSAPTP